MSLYSTLCNPLTALHGNPLHLFISVTQLRRDRGSISWKPRGAFTAVKEEPDLVKPKYPVPMLKNTELICHALSRCRVACIVENLFPRLGRVQDIP